MTIIRSGTEVPMDAKNGPPTWRLFALDHLPLPCLNCGDLHAYISAPVNPGRCRPVLFPPGVPTPPFRGQVLELALTEPTEASATEELLAYSHLEARVREDAIRCERCGERFEDLEVYRLHACGA